MKCVEDHTLAILRTKRPACLRVRRLAAVVTETTQAHHSLTEIRRTQGLEASKAFAGHREIGVTQHYAEQDQLLARKVMLGQG